MASPTKRVKVRRSLAKARQAKKRKNHERNYGSTLKNLPLDAPNAHERNLLSK
jgi:hypothetical protein